MIKTAPPPLAEPEINSDAGTDDLPILLTEGEPIGESVFPHSALEDQQHPEAHRAQDDLAPPLTEVDAAGTATSASAKPGLEVQVHKARLQDARDIFDLVNSLSGDGTLLRR